MKTRIALALALAAALHLRPAHAQQSASYKLREFVLNEGGQPNQGAVLASTSFRMKLASVGDALTARALASASLRSEAGFAVGYPPPGEALGLLYPDKTTMVWHHEKSVGTYNVYRSLVSGLPGLGYGACFARALSVAIAVDPEDPPDDAGWFYLVTAENLLREEGTKGNRSNGTTRGNPVPCP